MSLVSYFPFRKDPYDRCNGIVPYSGINLTETSDNRFGRALADGVVYFTAAQAAELLNNANETSFSFWIYVPADATGTSIMFGLDDMSNFPYRRFGIFQYPSPNDLHLSWQNKSGTVQMGGVAYDAFKSGEWTHCAIVYKQGVGAKIYINGVYTTIMGSGATYDISDGTFSANYPAWRGNSAIRYLADCRIYNHALSPKEVKELSYGLIAKITGESLLAYKDSDSDDYLNDANIMDESGHEWISSGRGKGAWADGSRFIDTAVPSNVKECLFLKGPDCYNYIAFTDFPQLTHAVTYACWVYPLGSTSTYQFLVGQGRDYGYGRGSSLALGADLKPAMINGNGSASQWLSAGTALTPETWNHLVGTYDGSTTNLYVNGVLAATSQDVTGDLAFGDMDNNALVIGKMGYSYTSTGYYFPFQGGLRDIRVYNTALNSAAVEALYKTGQAIDKNGRLMVKNLKETGTSDVSEGFPSISRDGLRVASEMTELITLEDGSTWIQLQHHDMENGAGGRFSSQTAVGTTMYYDSPKVWSCFPLINSTRIDHGDGYEFLVVESTYTYTAPVRYRWKQEVNPYKATFSDTTYANITPIENIVSPFGGMYYTPTYGTTFCFNNGNNGNWFGCGNVTAYQGGGCPGRSNTTRYNIQDVFMRIYNPEQFRQFKNGLVSASEIKCII